MRIATIPQSGLAHRPGITLIEVLLGLAIFLMSIAAILKLVDIGADNAMEATLQSDGTRLAQSKLAEVEAGAISASAGGSGTCENEPAWSWNVVSTPANVPNLYTITVTLTHDFQGQPLEVSLTQMIYDPMAMGTAAKIPNPVTGTTGSSTTTTTTGTTP